MPKDYEKLSKLSQDVFNISSVLYKYCKELKDDEEIVKINPILKLLNDKADDLCFSMCEMENKINTEIS